MLRWVVSASRNKSEYEDILDVEDDDEAEESGDERGVEGLSCGNSTAMVPPKEGRLVSPHMVSVDARLMR